MRMLACRSIPLFLAACLLMHVPTVDAAEDETPALLQTFVDELVPITPGRGGFPRSFRMGSALSAAEQPVHEVTFDYEFAIAKYEVPQNLYEAVMGENPSRWKGPRNSVEMMTWQDARSFCEKLTGLLREAGLLGKEEEIRLPTEAEWEYCCRAGTTTAYSFGEQARADGDDGNKATLLDPYGWHTGNAAGNDPPVGALKPNPWGLYDMHGYLREFCADAWNDTYENAPADGSAWVEENADPKEVVVRSGSWKDRYDALRSASRMKWDVMKPDDAVGFRCVKASIR
jgi:formylglycine-generating enzyme required for sulfatase activity